MIFCIYVFLYIYASTCIENACVWCISRTGIAVCMFMFCEYYQRLFHRVAQVPSPSYPMWALQMLHVIFNVRYLQSSRFGHAGICVVLSYNILPFFYHRWLTKLRTCSYIHWPFGSFPFRHSHSFKKYFSYFSIWLFVFFFMMRQSF
jgi:hypothetical protein